MGRAEDIWDYVENHPGDASCPVRPVMITKQGCAPCAEVKGEVAVLLSSGKLEEFDVQDPRAQQLLEAAGVDMVPQVLLVDCNDRVVHQFNLDEDGPGSSGEQSEPQALGPEEDGDMAALKRIVFENVRRLAVSKKP